jgi:hypothetical protein
MFIVSPPPGDVSASKFVLVVTLNVAIRYVHPDGK